MSEHRVDPDASRTSKRAEGTPEHRRAQLLAHVEGQGFCTVIELAAALNVSDMTVRRDVRRLVAEKRLRSFHGGVALLHPSELQGTHIAARADAMTAAKRAIAARALRYLPGSGAFAIDAGTTTLELARLLPDDERLHLVTTSVAVINALLGWTQLQVTCPGGTLHPQAAAFAGPATSAALQELRVQTVFLAASGLRAEGVYSGSDFDAVTKRAFVKIADEVILLADSSKFALTALVRACSFQDVSRIIIDDGITDEQRSMLAASGVAVEVVSSALGDPVSAG